MANFTEPTYKSPFGALLTGKLVGDQQEYANANKDELLAQEQMATQKKKQQLAEFMQQIQMREAEAALKQRKAEAEMPYVDDNLRAALDKKRAEAEQASAHARHYNQPLDTQDVSLMLQVASQMNANSPGSGDALARAAMAKMKSKFGGVELGVDDTTVDAMQRGLVQSPEFLRKRDLRREQDAAALKRIQAKGAGGTAKVPTDLNSRLTAYVAMVKAGVKEPAEIKANAQAVMDLIKNDRRLSQELKDQYMTYISQLNIGYRKKPKDPNGAGALLEGATKGSVPTKIPGVTREQ